MFGRSIEDLRRQAKESIKQGAKEKIAQEEANRQAELGKIAQEEANLEKEKKAINKIYYIAGAIALIGTAIILYKTRKK